MLDCIYYCHRVVFVGFCDKQNSFGWLLFSSPVTDLALLVTFRTFNREVTKSDKLCRVSSL